MSSSVLSFASTSAFHVSSPSRSATSPNRRDGIDVADELQRVLGAVGQLVDVDEQRVHLPRRAGIARSDPLIVPAGPLELCVDHRQLIVEQCVVMAELEELRVGELEDLQCRLRAGRRVVDERRVPRRDDEVVGQVGEAVRRTLCLLLRAQRLALAAQQRRDLFAVAAQQLVGVISGAPSALTVKTT